ncbi:MAG TPA: tetratricopeptide repeat protein [Blastocatellia bacterium]|nr:tetratricopeptide repeat protein [Blastocatellia bacterium]
MKVKILFLGANPVDARGRLRLDEEIRDIGERIRAGPHRDSLILESEWAVRSADLQKALLSHEPHVVHFSGHGQGQEIILEDRAGKGKPVSKEALTKLFAILKDNIRIVVLNACYARHQAEALTETIDFAIGMNGAILDKGARIFSAHFYQALAFGRSVKVAFDLAVNQLLIEGIQGADKPELLCRKGIDPSQCFLVTQPGPVGESATEPGMNAEQLAGGEAKKGLSAIAFLPLQFSAIATGLVTDVSRRFLGNDGDWPDVASMIAQPVIVTFGLVVAFLAAAALLLPGHPLIGGAASRRLLKKGLGSRKAIFTTGIVAVIALGLKLSLPAFAHAFNQRGFQYHAQGNLSAARESYERAVRLQPGYAAAHYDLATAYEDSQPDKAIEEYLLAIKYDSHIYPAYNNLARLYLIRGENDDHDRALTELIRARDLFPQGESAEEMNAQYSLYKNLGWADYALANYLQAEKELARAISLRPDRAAAHCLMAYVLKKLGKTGVNGECHDCVAMSNNENDVEGKWLSDAKECLMKRQK